LIAHHGQQQAVKVLVFVAGHAIEETIAMFCKRFGNTSDDKDGPCARFLYSLYRYVFSGQDHPKIR
jgi:hypothetical protein